MTNVDWNGGIDLLQQWANRGEPFSANSCRAELRELGFSRFSTGTLFLAAEADGIIRKVGLERSSDRPTHGSHIMQWIGAEHRVTDRTPTGESIAVQRDRRGQFTTPQGFTDVPLFDVAEVPS